MNKTIRSLKPRLLGGGVWALAANAGTGFMTVALSAVAARLLSPAELGIFFLCFSVVVVAALLARMGLEKAGLRLVAECLAKGQHASARLTILKVFVLAGCALALVISAILSGFGDWIALTVFDSVSMASVTGLIALWVIVCNLQTLIPEMFRAFQDIRLASIFLVKNIFGGLLTGVLSGALLLFFLARGETLSLNGIIILIISCGSVGGILASLLLIKKLRTLAGGKAAAPQYATLVQAGIPLMFTNLSMVVLLQADLWIVGAFRSAEEVAVYGTCTRVIKLVAVILLVVNEVLPPFIVRLNVNGDKKELERLLRTAALFAAAPAFLVLIGLILYGGPLLQLLFGPDFIAGKTIVILLGIGALVNAWTGSCGMTLVMTGHQRDVLIITLTAGLITVVGGIAVAERFGPNGVAAVAASALILQSMAMLVFARIRCQVWTHASVRLGFQVLVGLLPRKRQ